MFLLYLTEVHSHVAERMGVKDLCQLGWCHHSKVGRPLLCGVHLRPAGSEAELLSKHAKNTRILVCQNQQSHAT